VTDQRVLIAVAVRICSSKLKSVGGKVEKKQFVLFSSSTQIAMYDNVVEVTMQAFINNRTKNRFGGAVAQPSWFNDLITVDRSSKFTKPPDYELVQTDFALQAAAYYDPNVSQVVRSQDWQLNSGFKVGEAGRKREV